VTPDALESEAPLDSSMPIAQAALVGAVGLASVAFSFEAAPGWSGAAGAGLALITLAIAVIDRQRQIIPDPLNALALGVGLIAAALQPDLSALASVANALIRAIVMATLFYTFREAYRKVRGIEGMGLGDVKLAAVAGAWLDWNDLPLVVEIATLGALAVVLTGRLRGRRFTASTRLPFGSFLAPAIWVCWAIGAWRSDLAAF
jgi:leader peptidase (prepilin peptidase) / N-methyltransferase